MKYKKLKYISFSHQDGIIYNVVYHVYGEPPKNTKDYLTVSENYHLVRINDTFKQWVNKHNINLDEMVEDDEEVFLFENILTNGKMV